jgi:hypothetical protein
MAVNQTGLPLQRGRTRQLSVSRALRLNELGLVAGAVAIVCILSILFLAQTGRVATANYRLQALEREHVALTHEAEQYEYRLAKASRLDVLAERAERLGLRPVTGEQVRYATIELPAVPMVASTSER